MTPCVKCGEGAQVAMSFNYGSMEVWLGDIGPGFDRHAMYALCEMHADRMAPPVGWVLYDNRCDSEPPLFLTADMLRPVIPQLAIDGVA